MDKLSTLCPNSLQFHYILLQFSIKFEQECNNNFIIALLLGLQCNNNLLLHSCSNFKLNQCLINETNITLPTVPTLKIFWLSIKSCIARSYLSNWNYFRIQNLLKSRVTKLSFSTSFLDVINKVSFCTRHLLIKSETKI